MVAARTARRQSCSARSPSVAFVTSSEADGTPKESTDQRAQQRDGRGCTTPGPLSRRERPASISTTITAMQVAAVVLHYRGWPGMGHALDALLNGERAPDKLLIVDNCPRCQAAAQIEQAYPMAEVIRADSNLGYAGGMNLGLARVSDADAVLLLTQDCVLDPAALRVMLRGARGPRRGCGWPAGRGRRLGESLGSGRMGHTERC
jgi:hypothetical protein